MSETPKTNDGGPAFPQADLSGYGFGPAMRGDEYVTNGMSLRDWFAGQALAGRMARQSQYKSWSDAAADAMLLVRATSSEPSA